MIQFSIYNIKDFVVNVSNIHENLKNSLNNSKKIKDFQIKVVDTKYINLYINMSQTQTIDIQKNLLHNYVNRVLSIAISGIKGIQSVNKKLLEKTSKGKSMILDKMNISNKSKRIVLEVSIEKNNHIDLSKIFEMLNIVSNNFISNNINDINTYLGIEAARNLLICELFDAYQAYGIYINEHHIELLADCLLYNGTLMKASKDGLNKRNTGVLTRSSFEESFKMIMNAGSLSEFDNLNGVSSTIVLGQVSKMGTGFPQIILN